MLQGHPGAAPDRPYAFLPQRATPMQAERMAQALPELRNDPTAALATREVEKRHATEVREQHKGALQAQRNLERKKAAGWEEFKRNKEAAKKRARRLRSAGVHAADVDALLARGERSSSVATSRASSARGPGRRPPTAVPARPASRGS